MALFFFLSLNFPRILLTSTSTWEKKKHQQAKQNKSAMPLKLVCPSYTSNLPLWARRDGTLWYHADWMDNSRRDIDGEKKTQKRMWMKERERGRDQIKGHGLWNLGVFLGTTSLQGMTQLYFEGDNMVLNSGILVCQLSYWYTDTHGRHLLVMIFCTSEISVAVKWLSLWQWNEGSMCLNKSFCLNQRAVISERLCLFTAFKVMSAWPFLKTDQGS